MEFLITEQQLKVILEQQDNSQMTDYMKTLYTFTSNMVRKVSKVYNLNLKMLLTWGTSVGGMVMPLDNYIKTGNFNLTDDQRMLVLSGVVFILFFEGRRGLKKILDKIKEEGIQEQFENAINKANELKNAFKDFMETVISSTVIFSETIAYSFLIPIITDIAEIAHKTTNIKEAATNIAERLIASGVVIVGREALISIIRKLLRKLK